MAKKDRTDRQAVIDSIRNKQKGAEKRRGFAILGVCVTVALLIVGAAAYQPIKDWYDLRGFSSKNLDEIGAVADSCGEITTKKAERHPGPRRARHPAPVRGHAPGLRPALQRVGRHRAQALHDHRPPRRGQLVHNLEHGYTILWYDKTVADSDSDDGRPPGHRDEVRRHRQTSATSSRPCRGPPRTATPSPAASTSRSRTGPSAARARPTPPSRWASSSTARPRAAPRCEHLHGEYPYLDSPEPTVI